MKRTMLLIGLFILSGCDLRKREIEMDKKASELRQKEQELNLREQSLQLREDKLNEKQKFLDSTNRMMNDSLAKEYPYIPGTWLVEMECTETNCPGSAVGDISNEQWEFKFQDNHVIVSATRNNNLVRVYTGDFDDGWLSLAEQLGSSANTTFIRYKHIKAITRSSYSSSWVVPLYRSYPKLPLSGSPSRLFCA